MPNNEYDCLKLENQLCFPLYAAARNITSAYTPFLKPLGLTYTQYVVFLVLFDHPEINVGELGKTLYLDSGTLTPLLKKMESEGYLTRHRSKEDERITIVNITEKGLEMRETLREVPAKVGCKLKLEPEEAKELYKLLYKVLGNN
ncbi:MAG: MarR family transcriptional regulator [Acholeplasmatales bacterium]|nr:MarR family transcriptional regulator [Acholeplasmatales bacterium]